MVGTYYYYWIGRDRYLYIGAGAVVTRLVGVEQMFAKKSNGIDAKLNEHLFSRNFALAR